MIRPALMALGLASLVLAGCGKDDSTGPSSTGTATGTLTLLNDSNTPVVAVHFSRCEDDSWGPNRLGASETLAPAAIRQWTVEAGCYDVRASTGARSATWFDREVPVNGSLQLGVPSGVDAMVLETSVAAVRKTR